MPKIGVVSLFYTSDPTRGCRPHWETRKRLCKQVVVNAVEGAEMAEWLKTAPPLPLPVALEPSKDGTTAGTAPVRTT